MFKVTLQKKEKAKIKKFVTYIPEKIGEAKIGKKEGKKAISSNKKTNWNVEEENNNLYYF